MRMDFQTQRRLILYAALVYFFTTSKCKASSSHVVTVREGNNAVLPCEYQHPEPDPLPSVIEWLRQGRDLPVFIKIGKYSPHIDDNFGDRMKVSAGKADLTIHRVEATDEGWYECRVIFLQKEETTARSILRNEEHVNGTHVKLVVTAPPVFKYTPPDTITRREGEVLLLRCRAAGRPTPSITWLKDGIPVKNGQDGVKLSQSELLIESLKKIHKGRYSCRAQNVEGQIEQSTTVYIQGAPVFVTVPHNATVKEAQDAMFSCKAEGYPATIKYTWFYNGEPVEESDEIRGRYGALGDGTLIIYNVVADDGGTVTCRASNGFGEPPSATATLTVQFPARVSRMPSLLYAGLGLTTTLPCPAVAVPPVTTVTWRKNGQLIKLDQEERFSLGDNGSLVISDVVQVDASRYTCTPYNILGTLGESIETRLIVRYPPYFTTRPNTSYQAEIGKPLIVPCEGAGDPPPHVSWVKLNDDRSVVKDIGDTDSRVSYEHGNLTVTSVVKSDHGIWQCVLSNPVASVKHDVMIFVRYTTPHAVSNISVTTSRHSAQISWKSGYDGGYAQHFMIWYKRADMGDHSWQTQSVESYRKLATVSGLEADTIYQFALLPENVLGSGQFSKTITAKTKAIPPPTPTAEVESLPSPGRMDSHITEDGLLLLMWQPPMDTQPQDLLGYVIEFRMLLENETEDNKETKHEEGMITDPTPTTTRIPEAPLRRSKRSQARSKWNRLVLLRNKRDAVPSTETVLEDNPQPKWSAWAILAHVNSSQTSFIVSDQLFRDQLYEFHVMSVSRSAYSSPSSPLTVSTKDLDSYPVFVGPAFYTAGGMNPGVTAAIVTSVVFVVIILILTSLYCRHKHRRKSALGNPSFTFGSLKEDRLDRRSRSKSESPSAKSNDSKGLDAKNEKIGRLSKLKKKMLKADVEMGQAYSSTDELVGLTRKVSTKSNSDQPLPEKSGGGTLIRKISRASDGKFHISDQSSMPSDSVIGDSDSLIPDSKSGKSTKSPSRRSGHSFSSRSHSLEWDAKSPLLQAPASANGDESLEIDCSHSDIEVRYIKDGRGKGRCQSTSMSSLSGPRQYNIARRHVGPLDHSMDSSMGDGSFTTPGEFQHPIPPTIRGNIVSPVPQMPPYAQYVHVRGNGTPRRGRNPEYRISSPPRFPDYNPTPGSPPKYRYHKHADQPGGHYHVSPRDSYSTPADRLVYDPRFTRIEPIYEVGYRPNNPPNRHSSFVIDTRRELPNNPYPHRAIQIYRTGPPAPDGVNYPTPHWHDSSSRYHTLPHQNINNQMSSSADADPDNVEASLLRHNANATSPSRKEQLNTNSLGRRRKKSGESPRRRVHSMDDLSRDSPIPSDTTITADKAGSVDLLSSPRRKSSIGEQYIPESESLPQDRTTGGSDAGDEASDVTLSSLTDTSRVPNIAMTSRYRDSGMDNVARPSTARVVVSVPTSPRDDDSSALSSLVHAPVIHHRPLEITSSGYDSHNTSQNSDSPAASCSSPNVTIRPSLHDHDRTSTASSSDRSRKDTSSVDEKYEWDSEYAMESEILEALRHFGTHKRSGSVSQALVDEIKKLGMDKLQEMGQDEFASLEKAVVDRHRHSPEDDQSTAVDTSDMYTKESMERRCAALRKEYQRYQMEQITLPSDHTTVAANEVFSTTPANA